MAVGSGEEEQRMVRGTKYVDLVCVNERSALCDTKNRCWVNKLTRLEHWEIFRYVGHKKFQIEIELVSPGTRSLSKTVEKRLKQFSKPFQTVTFTSDLRPDLSKLHTIPPGSVMSRTQTVLKDDLRSLLWAVPLLTDME